MDLMAHLGMVDWLAALVAGTLSFFIGAVWYGPLFGKAWMDAAGVTMEEVQDGHPGKVYGFSLLASFLAAVLLSLLIADGSWLYGATLGLLVGAVFIGGCFLTSYLFEGRRIKLWLINGGFHTVQFTVMGAILGAWPW